ncbi:transcriptional regulator [Agrobacterium vitis]|uniref:Transcriptional regulator n=1 Tax=Agrobacterium vitis TaxID=373 RepID=A0A1S2DZV5_AGRVI|nr:transcriptional repressor TraM [Agrobacterium vitis]MCF1501285.1 transcriptional regulator [Allorhizobium sp. Av2]MCM2443004.1 transcriptional regulator [Agrobacterium vitis]MUO82363.1 transcriptional regulator [Agrobacterium vitis]MUO96526.1 transcriptional regulator [Agrobacterium vitis]MUP07642.1 transcriptional regulator [Agrobacterium vitis]
MDADDRLNGEAVDLKPLIGLLNGLPSPLVERLTIDAIREHRDLLERAENLFNELPADVKAGKELVSDTHIAYLEATIRMHAQMSALTTLLHILGYTPKA